MSDALNCKTVRHDASHGDVRGLRNVERNTMKRKYTTAQAVSIISRNHDFKAKAPDTKDKLPETIEYTEDGFLFKFLDSDGYWVTNNTSVAPDRDDWEIIKPKRKCVVVGIVKYSSAPMVNNWWIEKQNFDALDKSKTYKLVAVER